MVKLLNLFVAPSIILSLIAPLSICAQCQSAAEMLAQLAGIENNEAVVAEKIRQTHQLQSTFLKCYKTKDSVYARMVHKLGSFYSNAGNIEKAISYTKEAVSINLALNNRAERQYLANSYFNLNNFYDLLYLREECYQYLDNCIAISTRFPDKYFIAFMAFERKAFNLFQTGDYQKSIETADKGILFASSIKDTLSEVPLLCQKAQSLVELNNPNDAETNIRKAILILQRSETSPDKLAIAYSIYANIHLKQGDNNAAINYYKKAIGLNKSIQNWEQCTRDLTDLGVLYDVQLQNASKAMACYNEGLDIVNKARDDYRTAALFINIGVSKWRQKNYRQSLLYYQKALNTLPINFTDTSIISNPSEKGLRLSANEYFVSTLLSNKAESLLDLIKKRGRNNF